MSSAGAQMGWLIRLGIATLVGIALGHVVLNSVEGFDAFEESPNEARSFFDSSVAPLLGSSCGGERRQEGFRCHAQPSKRFEELDGTTGHPGDGLTFFFPVDEESRGITSDEHIEKTYQRLLREGNDRAQLVDMSSEPRFSAVLRKPLTESAGGLAHGGGDVLRSLRDPLFTALARWIALEQKHRSTEPTPLEGGDAGRFYKERVLPVLVNNQCMAPACHEFNHSSIRFDSGIEPTDPTDPIHGRFNNVIANANRRASLGLITNQLFLSGDVSQSRFVRKPLPLGSGGVLHRGGNHQFLDGIEDPDFLTLVEWATLERAEQLRNTRINGRPVTNEEVGAVRGVIFVRLPRGQHRRFLDASKYQPGSDIWLLPLEEGETLETASGSPVNLTAPFHPGVEADVREPELRYDGRALLFAMRIGEEDGLNIYEIQLDDDLRYEEGSFRRLTYGPSTARGVQVHFTDPTWVPSADDENAAMSGFNLDAADIVFATNIDGEVAPSEEYGMLGEIDGGDASMVLDWERLESDGAYVGRRVVFLNTTDGAVTRRIVSFENRVVRHPSGPTRIVLDQPLPEPVRPGDHYIIERDEIDPVEYLPAYSLYGMVHPDRGEEEATFRQSANRVTFSPNQELDVSVRSTGEVFFASLRNTGYSRHRPVFNVGRNRRHLDHGMSFPTHRGNRSRLRVYADYHELAGGNEIFVGLSPDTLWESGALFVADHQLGCAFEIGNPVDGVTYLYSSPGSPGVGESPSHPRMVPSISALFSNTGPEAITDHGLSPGGTFRDPRPLPDSSVLVSRAPGPVDLTDPEARPDFDLYVLRGGPGFYGEPGGFAPPQAALAPIASANSNEFSEIQAIPIVVRFKERMRASRREEGGRFIRENSATTSETATGLFCERNYRVIDAFIDDNVPSGRHVTYDSDPVTGESVSSLDRVVFIRIVEGLPWTKAQVEGLDPSKVGNGDPHSTWVSNGIHPAKRIIAEVSLDEDGNVCFPVPAGVPFVYQSLNENRMALRSLNRWFFIAPGERFGASVSNVDSFQQCAACHGSMTGRAQDAFGPMDVMGAGGCSAACHDEEGRPTKVATLDAPTSGSPLERLNKGATLVEPSDRIAVTFSEDVQPIFDSRCVICHDGSGGSPAPDLSDEPTHYYNRAYESLMALEHRESRNQDARRYVAEREASAIESFLIEKLLGRELRAPRTLTGDQPHPSRELIEQLGVASEPLSEEELLVLIRWIDLGAVFRSPAAAEKLREHERER